MASARKCFHNHKSLHTWRGLFILKELKTEAEVKSSTHPFSGPEACAGIHGDQDSRGAASRKLAAQRGLCRRPVTAGGTWGAAGLQDEMA